MTRLKAATATVSLEKIAKIYKNKIWKLYKVPQKVLSDKRPQFTSKFIVNLIKALETKRILSIAYYPQTDGQTK